MQAMILAAGFGTRLLPHTLIKPKPLFPILNHPLLLLTIRHLQRQGFDHIIVNCHHLREQIVAALAGITGVVVQEEEEILGTGGGLRMALPLMRDEMILVTNGDIYHAIDYRQLYAAHIMAGNMVTLAMHDYPKFNTVTTREGRVWSFDAGNERNKLAFTGLHVMHPKVLQSLPWGKSSCIIDVYRKMLSNNEPIHFHRVDGSFWTDMGTSNDYLALHGGLLKGAIPCWEEFPDTGDKPFLIDKRAMIDKSCVLQDWASLGAVTTGCQVRLERVVAWDGVIFPENCVYTDALFSCSPEPCSTIK